MKAFGSFLVALVLAGVLIAGCGQAAPASAPTTSSTAPKAAEPTKAAAPATGTSAATAAPTAAPKVDYPQKGRAITYIAPYAAGGSSDTIMRLMQPILEKQLGVPINIVNKEGAGSQVGTTELALSKPDGYTFGYTSLPTVNTIYLDPDRKAAFSRKDLQALAMHDIDYNVLAVKADSPIKTVKDLVDAAKAKPGKLSITSSGIMSITHMGILSFEQAAGIDINIVQFNGQGPATTALLGGHVDVTCGYVGTLASAIKNNSIRVIGVMGPERNKFVPDVPTVQEQGIKDVIAPNIRGFIMPAGAPQQVIDTLANALKAATEDPQHVKQMEEQYYTVRYAGPKEFGAMMDEWDTRVKPLMDLAKKDTAQ